MEERSVGKTQPSPAGSGRSFPRGRSDTWVNDAARDATCCSARARPCGRGVLSQTVLTQGSTQVRAHRPGQVGSGSPRDPSWDSQGPVVWLEPGEGQDGAAGPWPSRLGLRRGSGRESHLLGAPLGGGKQSPGTFLRILGPLPWRRQAG